MKRLTVTGIGAAVVIALATVLITAVAWVVATTQGARWLLTTVAPQSGIGFSVQKIEGRIIDHLYLAGVRITLPLRRVELDSLELRWRPLLLLSGTVAVRELVLDGVRIQDNAPPDNKQPVLAWPKVSDSAHLFDATIARLRVTRLSYRRLQGQSVPVTSLTAAVTWQDDLLSLNELSVVSPSGQTSGAVSAGFKRPELIADLTVALPHPVAGMDRFLLHARPGRDTGPEPFVVTVALAGAAGKRKLLELGVDVGMAQKAFNLRHLRLFRPGKKGVVTADGSLSFTAIESLFTLQVKAAGLDLAPELSVPTDLSGILNFAGTPDSYRGDFTLANKADGWQAATVSASYHGNTEGIKLVPLTVKALDGTLAGNLDMNWHDGFELQGTINGRNLNPARLDPDWKGVANFNAVGDLAWSEKTDFTGSVSGTILESSLHGQALTGELQAEFADSKFSISRLALQGKGFDLRAAGKFDRKLTLSAEISDFSRLVPGSAGTFRSDGWVRWREGHLSGAAVGTGSRLAYAGMKIAAANLDVRLDQGRDYPLHVAASLRDVVYGNYTAKNVSVMADGFMLPGQRFKLDGTAVLSGGVLHRKNGDGELNLVFTKASATWGWRNEELAGSLFLTMAEYSQASANFQLPVPARFPITVNPAGPLRWTLVGQFKDKGVAAALIPGLVQESFGELDAELTVGGSWEVPQIGGKARLVKGGAYLPGAGIHLKDVQVTAHMEKDLILIDSYRALSGSGYIEGTAFLSMDGWQVTGYRGTILGENFQTFHFPELRILSSPKLTFEGTPQKLSLRGELLLPELHFIGASSHKVIAPSSDTIREGIIVPAAKSSPLVLDVQIRLLIGEQVFVDIAGIEAQLGGGMDLSLSSLDSITSRGEIRVVKGRYRTYGVDLEIVRGRLFFAGGPIDKPSLDFLALRTVGDVRAGVSVAGTLQEPLARLYSEPPMPDVDVLGYIVLGHPLGSGGEQADLMTKAAGALLTSGQAEVVQNQIKSQLGLSSLEIKGGVGGTSGSMGYKPLQVTAPGAIPTVQQPGITETMLTVGKYLTPQLYISYGRSLFTGSNLFLLRYDIFKKWQIETQTGSESGADLFYKLEFK